MPVLDFKEIPQANNADGEQDTFELFARDFFEALGYQIETSPSRGPDGGKDLIIIEPLTGVITKSSKKWIVSCKHKAHSGNSVRADDEIDLIGRTTNFEADGFIGFYSTLPSSGLSDSFERSKNRISIEVFDRRRIEKYVLFDPRLRQVLRQYFPKDYHHLTQNYTWEIFYRTLLTLITDNIPLKERLINAYIGGLMNLESSDFPNDMQEEFKILKNNFTKVQPEHDEGQVVATVNAMTLDEAKEIAETILSMYERYRTRIIDDVWQDNQ